MATISTGFKLPTAVIQNGQGVVGWTDPDNILLVDDRFAVSGGPTNILEVGMFNHNVPQGATINNITVRIKGYRGSFNTTLDIYAVDDTSGVAFAYPYTPAFQSFSGSNTLYTLNTTLFATTWTVDQINNIKFKLIADGELHMDSIEVDVQYTEEDPAPAPSGDTGEEVCDEFVQAQPFKLAQSVTSGELFIYLESFAYPDGDPIQFADFHGEDALLVIDQGIPGKEENVRITAVEQNYNGTETCRISFGVIENRGLKFKYPYDHDIDLCQDHSSTAEVVISNSAPFYSRFLKKCNIDALVSAPITVKDEGVNVVTALHKADFRGAGVSVTTDPLDPTHDVIITIPGNGVNPPAVSSTSSSSSGTAQVPTLTWQHVSSGINRGLLVQISTEESKTVSSVTYNGIALTQVVSETDAGNNIRQEQWFLVAPPVGTYNIVITMSANAYVTAGAETINGVNQSTPTGATQTATGTSNSPAQILTTTVDNSLVFDGLATATTPISYTVGAGQDVNWTINSNLNTRQGASSTEPAGSQPDNVTMNWSMTQITDWVITSVEIIGISSGTGSGVQSVTGLDTDNTDPLNPIVQIAVDGVTIIGDGTPGNPLVAVGGGGGGGASYVDQTPDNGTYGLLVGAVDGVNDTYTTSQGEYLTGKLRVFLNGLIQLQGATDDWVELVPGSGTFQFNTPPQVGDIITVVYETSAGSADNYTVKATGADTTPNYLDDKISIVSSDGSVSITKTINNPAANEDIEYDITTTPSVTSVNAFDDFTSGFEVSDSGPSTFAIFTSGNFQKTSSGSANVAGYTMTAEPNHPGIVSLTQNGSLTGFTTSDDGTLGNGLLNFEDPFTITMLARNTSTGSNWQVDYRLIGGSNDVRVHFDDDGFIYYNIGGGNVITAFTVPASGTWFEVVFTYDGATLTMTADGNTIYTGAIVLTGDYSILFEVTDDVQLTAASLDYVKVAYQVTR